MTPLIRQFVDELTKFIGRNDAQPPVDRALDADVVWSRVMQLVRDTDEWDEWAYPYVVNIMLDDVQNYVVVTDRGRLFKANVSIDGADIVLGDFTEVMLEFVDVERNKSAMSVHRAKDGKLCFVAIAGSATINRNGELDSTLLFDNIEANYVKRADDDPDIPLRFHHIDGGKADFGVVRGVARYESFLMIWGDIDETTPLGSVAETRFNEGGWGNSIGFFPTAYEMLEITDGVQIRMYTDGRLSELSVLREEHAAHYFTNIVSTSAEVARMADQVELKNRLKEFLGEVANVDTVIEGIISEADIRQRTIENEGMITRTTDDPATPQPIAESPTIELTVAEGETVPVVTEKIVELDDTTLRTITDSVVAQLSSVIIERVDFAVRDAIKPQIAQLETKLDRHNAEIETLRGMGVRLEEVEKADDIKIIRRLNDLPQSQTEIIRVGSRASQPNTSEMVDDSATDMPATFGELMSQKL